MVWSLCLDSFLCVWRSSCPRTTFWRDCLCAIMSPWYLLWKISWLSLHESVSEFCVSSVLHYLNYYSFIVSLEVGECWSSNFVLLIKFCFCYSGSFASPYKHQNHFVNIHKIMCWDYWGFIAYVYQVGKKSHLDRTESSYPWTWKTLHLFSFLISLIRIL